MYSSFGGAASGQSQRSSNFGCFVQDPFTSSDFCIGFENESRGYGFGGYSTGFFVPKPNSAQQKVTQTNQSEQLPQRTSQALSDQPPPAPPRSVLYGHAESMMSFNNSQNLQYQMLEKMEAIPKFEEPSLESASKELQKTEETSSSKTTETAAKPKSMKQHKSLERAKTVGELLKKDAKLKEKVRQSFIDELMKQQETSGTFELTEGTVKPFTAYSAGDPVQIFSAQERNVDLTGKAWDSEADSEYLRKAMKGLGTDEDAIIHVITTRCNNQRQQLKEKYQTMYGRHLVEDLDSELSGDFREAVMACFVRPAQFDAWSIKEAIFGLGTDEQTLIEILMTRTNEQLHELKNAYSGVTSPNTPKQAALAMLDEDICDDTSGDFKRLLRAAANGNRTMITREQLEKAVEEVMVNGTPTGTFQVNYGKLVNKQRCKEEAKALFEAGEDRWGTDEETFIKIFSLRNYYELRAIWTDYVKISQRDILNSIDRETSVKNIRCRPMYLAERLQQSMKGLGTNDKDLIRIIVSRSEIDMVQIKECFQELTKQSLWRWLKDDCSGDYRKLLQGLVGEG
ncbi:annexin-B12-like isoform X2 [Watersipora subatra]|uniref:annexin-B12-like isoform X2 n=1 Tax=Watersipora subatra TaxID=2589382 RepID=UPI00355AFCD4